jgi:hypothetical protein
MIQLHEGGLMVIIGHEAERYVRNSLRNFNKETILTGSRSLGHVFHCLLDLN